MGEPADNLNDLNLGDAPALPAAELPAAEPVPGATVGRADLLALSKGDLQARAKELGIKVAPNAGKPVLVDAILGENDDGQAGATDPLTRAEAWARVDNSRQAGVKPNLSNSDLSSVDFTTPQFKRRIEAGTGKTVTDTVFIGMDFHGVDFTNCNLEGTNFMNSNLQGCTFTGCSGTPKLDGADLRWSIDAAWAPVDGEFQV